MKWVATIVIALFFIVISATEVEAQSITISGTTSSKGKIAVSTKVVLPDKWNVVQVELFAKPPKNGAGEGGYAVAEDKTKGSFVGTMTVPAGKYDVQALLTAKDPAGKTHYYYSLTSFGVDAS